MSAAAGAARVVVVRLAKGEHGRAVAAQHGAEDGEREERDEARRALFGAGLGFEEIHQVKWVTFGARSAGQKTIRPGSVRSGRSVA